MGYLDTWEATAEEANAPQSFLSNETALGMRVTVLSWNGVPTNIKVIMDFNMHKIVIAIPFCNFKMFYFDSIS